MTGPWSAGLSAVMIHPIEIASNELTTMYVKERSQPVTKQARSPNTSYASATSPPEAGMIDVTSA